ncbi:putative oxidoreductase YmfI [Tachypleus tridentatus]|uniref:putative oxidoreductase YmfI n=1 Tax=Tachypleus tridentatus TaxID=6853 RepID=UPI003FD36281
MKSTIDTYGRLDICSVYHLTMLAFPHLIESKGSIVNVSSVLSKRGCARTLSNSMSKGALYQFTRSVALDLAPKQIRVNSVNPGFIETNILSTIGLDAKEIMEKAALSYPLGRGVQPQEVANAIAFLASYEASYITVETLVIDGAKTVSY